MSVVLREVDWSLVVSSKKWLSDDSKSNDGHRAKQTVVCLLTSAMKVCTRHPGCLTSSKGNMNWAVSQFSVSVTINLAPTCFSCCVTASSTQKRKRGGSDGSQLSSLIGSARASPLVRFSYLFIVSSAGQIDPSSNHHMPRRTVYSEAGVLWAYTTHVPTVLTFSVFSGYPMYGTLWSNILLLTSELLRKFSYCCLHTINRL